MIVGKIPLYEAIEDIQKMKIISEESFGCYFTSKTTNSKSFTFVVELQVTRFESKLKPKYEIRIDLNTETNKITRFMIGEDLAENNLYLDVLTHDFTIKDFPQFYDFLHKEIKK